MPVSSDDDYLSIDQYTAGETNTGKQWESAGRTPLPLKRVFSVLKCGSINVNQKLSMARTKSMKGMSNLFSSSRKERVISKSRKQRCLFNTMHVKTAMALITVFYLFALAVLDNYLFWQDIDYYESIFLSITSIVIIVSIITAQFGLNFEKYRLIFPFFIVQTLFLGAIYVGYSREIANQIFYAKSHPQIIVRLILIILYQVIIILMHTYALLITVRCIVYFRNKKLCNMDRLCFNNRCFLESVPNAKQKIKERIVNLKIDVTTDEEDAQSMNNALDSTVPITFANTFGSGNSLPTKPAVINPNKNVVKPVNNKNPFLDTDDELAGPSGGRAQFTETPKTALRFFKRASQSKVVKIGGNIFNGSTGIPSSNLGVAALSSSNVGGGEGGQTTHTSFNNELAEPPSLTNTTGIRNAPVVADFANNKRSVTFAGTTFHDISLLAKHNVY